MAATLDSRLVTLLVDTLGVDEDDITLAASLVDDLGADSLDRVELAMALEETYRLDEITDTDFEGVHTVQDLVTFLESRQVGRSVVKRK